MTGGAPPAEARAGRGPGRAALSLLLGLALGLAACAAPAGSLRLAGDAPSPPVREVPVRVMVPGRVNLADRGVRLVAVVPFEGPGGAEIADNLARQVGDAGPLRALTPAESLDRLMRAGLSVGWEAPPSTLAWLGQRGGVDGAVVGRVDTFAVEGQEKSEESVTLKRTGTYGFTLNEEGKVAYREKVEYAQVPLFCRTDRGTVGASYRVWSTTGDAPVLTSSQELTMEMPSFCYRGDVSDRLKREAQRRLLEKLFRELNARFLGEVMPRVEPAVLPFEVLPAGTDATLVHRNELGLVYAARGEWDRAREMWQECVAEKPQLAAAHFNLARVHQAEGRYTAAAGELAKALALKPNPLYRAALREARARLTPAE